MELHITTRFNIGLKEYCLRKSLLFLGLIVFLLQGHLIAQTNDKWEKIDSWSSPTSSTELRELLEELYLDTPVRNDDAQFIRVLSHFNEIRGGADSDLNSRELILKEIDTATGLRKSLLHLLAASAYQRDLEANVSKELSDKEKKSLRNAMAWNAFQAVNNDSLAVEESLHEFDFSLDLKEEDHIYFPSLYDWMSLKALSSLQSIETNRTRSSFLMKASETIVPLDTFLNQNFSSRDSLNLDFLSLQIYQQQLESLRERNEIYALIDTDLRRLKFCRSRSFGSVPRTRYQRSLLTLAEKYEGHPAVAEINYELAILLAQRAGAYQALESEEFREDFIKARDLCIKTIREFPKSRGAKKCRSLGQLIELPDLQAQIESYNLPWKPFRMRVSYRNLEELQAYIFRIPVKHWDKWNQLKGAKEQFEWLRTQKAFAYRRIPLPDIELLDYQRHSFEAPMPALAPGLFAIALSDGRNLRKQKQVLAILSTQISNHALYSQNDSIMLVLGFRRDDGKPLNSLEAIPVNSKDEGEANSLDSYRLKSDKGGLLKLPKISPNRRELVSGDNNGAIYNAAIRTTQRWLLFADGDTNRIEVPPGSQPYVKKGRIWQTTIFTDREVFAPGDIVNFKGIIKYKQGDYGQYQLVPDTTISIEMVDGEYKKMLKQELEVNSLGSFAGSFTIPTDVKPGAYTIITYGGGAIIEVKEYEFPSYEIQLATSDSAYLLGDTVQILGKIFNYDGSYAAGEEYRYRVIRSVNFPYWNNYYWWRQAPTREPYLTAWGKAKADATGSFRVDFRAIPDITLPNEVRPVYRYLIIVEVDRKGETSQSISTAVWVGPSSLALNAQIPKLWYKIEYPKLELQAKNLSGKVIPVKGDLKVSQLKVPDQVFRERLWAQVDLQTLSRGEYKEQFPFDAYGYEAKPESWESDSLWIDMRVNTDSITYPDLSKLDKAPAGIYRVELYAEDERGRTVKWLEHIRLEEQSGNPLPVPEVLDIQINGREFLPGDTVEAVFRSSIPGLSLWVNWDQFLESDSMALLQIDNGTYLWQAVVPKEASPGAKLSIKCWFQNEEYNRTFYLYREIPERSLKIQWLEKKDQFLPGEELNWRLKLTDVEGRPLEGEAIMLMYDQALDKVQELRYQFTNSYSRARRPVWKGDELKDHSSRLLPNASLTYRRFTPNLYPDWKSLSPRIPTYRYPGLQAVEDGLNQQLEKSKVRLFYKNSNSYSDGVILPPGPKEVQRRRLSLVYNSAEPTYISPSLIETHDIATAVWQPQVQSDSSGILNIRFQSPVNLATWEYKIFAHTEDLRFDLLEGSASTLQAFLSRWQAPSHLYAGDSLQIGLNVLNLGEDTLRTELSLTKYGRNISVDTLVQGAGWQGWEFPISIVEDSVQLDLFIEAKANKFQKRHELSIPIRPSENLAVQSQKIFQQESKGKLYPEISVPDYGKTTLMLAADPRDLIMPRLAGELSSKPFSLPEKAQQLLALTSAQNMGKLASRWRERLKSDSLPSETKALFIDLMKQQNSDGGWGWVPGMSADIRSTLEVLRYLGKTYKSDAELFNAKDSLQIQTAFSYLDSSMTQLKAERTLNLGAALARTYFPFVSARENIIEWEDAELTIEEKVILSMILFHESQKEKADQLWDEIIANESQYKGPLFLEAIFQQGRNKMDVNSIISEQLLNLSREQVIYLSWLLSQYSFPVKSELPSLLIKNGKKKRKLYKENPALISMEWEAGQSIPELSLKIKEAESFWGMTYTISKLDELPGNVRSEEGNPPVLKYDITGIDNLAIEQSDSVRINIFLSSLDTLDQLIINIPLAAGLVLDENESGWREEEGFFYYLRVDRQDIQIYIPQFSARRGFTWKLETLAKYKGNFALPPIWLQSKSKGYLGEAGNPASRIQIH